MESVNQGSYTQVIWGEETLATLSQILATASGLEELLPPLIKQVVETTSPADAGTVYLYDKMRQQLVAEASHGYPHNAVKFSLSPKEGAAGRCYAQRKPLLFPSTESVAEQTATLKPANLDCYLKIRRKLPPTLSLIATPLLLGENLFGVISLEHYKPHRSFNEADLLQLEAASGLISLLIDNLQSRLELKNTKRSYRELLGKFLARSEEERKKIAREIHDELNQLLLSVKLNLEGMEGVLPTDLVRARERLAVSRIHIDQALDGLRELSLNLRPPALDELGLPQALDWHIRRVSKESSLPVTLEVTGLSQRRPAPVAEIELFRIAQEALSNVIKHAKASSARVKLNFGKLRLVLLVEDNGTGFDTSSALSMSGDKQSLGLLGMRERAELCGGTLKIDSTPGDGTRIKVEIPVKSYDWGVY
ncbi:MAG: GAF domain-containing sensor histidine kinase [Dehalococcoidia bacterium]|jgi:signal transduction histidine kinase